MTNLLPHRDGQADMLENDGTRFSRDESGHWYSPNAVERMIEEARKEEREECAQLIDKEASCFIQGPTRSTHEKCAELIRKRGRK